MVDQNSKEIKTERYVYIHLCYHLTAKVKRDRTCKYQRIRPRIKTKLEPRKYWKFFQKRNTITKISLNEIRKSKEEFGRSTQVRKNK